MLARNVPDLDESLEPAAEGFEAGDRIHLPEKLGQPGNAAGYRPGNKTGPVSRLGRFAVDRLYT